MTDTVAESETRSAAPAEPLSYGSYLEVPSLLQLQHPHTDAHDEILFIVTHQAIELWFSCALHELERVRDALDRDLFSQARQGLRRLARMASLWLGHVDVLSTMTPAGFNEFRGTLGESSGFQSVQFRELEMISGLRDRRHLNLPGATPAEVERLRRRFDEPNLNDTFTEVLRRRGLDPETLYMTGRADDELLETAEDLLEYDALFQQWRHRHWMLVARTLGTRPGTGGSAGARFLWTTLGTWFFPELHAARSRVHPASSEGLAAAAETDAVSGCPMGYGSDLSA